MSALAVIGGTGTSELPGFQALREEPRDSPWGRPSAPLVHGTLGGQPLCCLPRHGRDRRLPPHAINYRANLWCLRQAGMRRVVALNAVGGLRAELAPGTLVVPDQLLDYTWGRAHSIHDGDCDSLEHIDFTRPYSDALRAELLRAIAAAGLQCEPRATHCVTQGPRLETAAEVRRLARDGGDVVGMTGMPEAALARELGLDYVSLCVVANPGAGLTDAALGMDSINAVLAAAAQRVGAALTSLLRLETG